MRTMITFVVGTIAVAVALSACSAAPDPAELTSTSEDLSTAADPPGRTPLPCTPFSLPADNCGFQIDVGCVSNNEFQTVTTRPDGTLIIDVTGRLVLSFTNHDTGTTIVRNVSGPTTTTVHPDGSGMETARGLNWFGFGPNSQANTGQPGLIFTSGLVDVQFADDNATSVTVAGTNTNGCDLLR